MLEGMGFPRVRCEKALHATGNADPDAAMEWLFGHMEDPDIDDPVDFNPKSGGGASAADSSLVTEEKLGMMEAMGLGIPQARQALMETGGDVERAVDWVFNHPDAQGVGAANDEGGETPALKEVSQVSCSRQHVFLHPLCPC